MLRRVLLVVKVRAPMGLKIVTPAEPRVEGILPVVLLDWDVELVVAVVASPA